jgi:hypothetical protein
MCKGRRAANKLHKLQIRKCADLFFYTIADLPQMWQFANRRFAGHIFLGYLRIRDLRTKLFFADLKLPQIRNKFYPYK